MTTRQPIRVDDAYRLEELVASGARAAGWGELSRVVDLARPAIASPLLDSSGLIFEIERSLRWIDRLGTTGEKVLARTSKILAQELTKLQEGSDEFDVLRLIRACTDVWELTEADLEDGPAPDAPASAAESAMQEAMGVHLSEAQRTAQENTRALLELIERRREEAKRLAESSSSTNHLAPIEGWAAETDYIQVDDIATTLTEAQQDRHAVVVPATDFGMDSFALIADQQGNLTGLVEVPSPGPDPACDNDRAVHPALPANMLTYEAQELVRAIDHVGRHSKNPLARKHLKLLRQEHATVGELPAPRCAKKLIPDDEAQELVRAIVHIGRYSSQLRQLLEGMRERYTNPLPPVPTPTIDAPVNRQEPRGSDPTARQSQSAEPSAEELARAIAIIGKASTCPERREQLVQGLVEAGVLSSVRNLARQLEVPTQLLLEAARHGVVQVSSIEAGTLAQEWKKGKAEKALSLDENVVPMVQQRVQNQRKHSNNWKAENKERRRVYSREYYQQRKAAAAGPPTA